MSAISNNSELKLFLNKLGFNDKSFENACESFRKDKKVTSINAEDSFQALEKFTTDFCKLALDNLKLDHTWSGSGLEEKCIRNSDKKVLIEISSEFFRPAEVDVLLADPSKAKRILGWEPENNLNDLVERMIDYEVSKIT